MSLQILPVTINGQTRFACYLCGSSYKEKSNVHHHISAKHKGKAFSCPYCNYSSCWKGHVKRHILNKHRDKKVQH